MWRDAGARGVTWVEELVERCAAEPLEAADAGTELAIAMMRQPAIAAASLRVVVNYYPLRPAKEDQGTPNVDRCSGFIRALSP